MHRFHLVAALILLGVASPARAELVIFSNGRSLSVKAHRRDDETLVLVLRSGGEIVCDPALVTRITQDEVPHPEPEAVDRSALFPADGTAAGHSFPNGLAVETAYDEVIERAAAREGVDPRLVRAVIRVESAYQTNARSPKGALGLMQLMPATLRAYGVVNPFDPVANIEAGIKHLKSLLSRFPRDLALAAYNAGEAAVQRFHGIPPFAETQNYVSRIRQIMGRS